MPAAAIDVNRRLLMTKRGGAKVGFLLSYKALAKVFRAKMLAGLAAIGLALPARYRARDRRLQIGRDRRRGARLLGTLSLPWRHQGIRYRRRRSGAGVFPVPRREDWEDGTANGAGRAISMGHAACAAEWLAAGPQFRLPAFELQASHRAAAGAAQICSGHGLGARQAAATGAVPVLWRGEEDRANLTQADAGANCGARGALTM